MDIELYILLPHKAARRGKHIAGLAAAIFDHQRAQYFAVSPITGNIRVTEYDVKARPRIAPETVLRTKNKRPATDEELEQFMCAFLEAAL